MFLRVSTRDHRAHTIVYLTALATWGACSASELGRDDAGTHEPGTHEPGTHEAGTRDDATVDVPLADASSCPPCPECEQTVVVSTNRHTQELLDYSDPPPAGGDHSPCWAPWGVHTEEVPDELWVHNLEHGGVVYLYHCPEGCELEVQQLAAFVMSKPQAMLTPYAGLTTRFGAVAWGHRLLSDCLDSSQFTEFYAAHVDRAPESITAGPPAVCQ